MAEILLSNGADATRPLQFLDDPACPPVALLISVAYWSRCKKLAKHPRVAWWALDSGAFSDRIELPRYLDAAREALSFEKPPRMVFSLDDLEDWQGSLRNYETVRDAGINAIPTYHYGRPSHMLHAICLEFERLAVGGLARIRGRARQQFLDRVFRYCWSSGSGRRIHGFGIGDATSLFGYPFDTVDSSTWSISSRTGEWPAYKRDPAIKPASGATLVPEVRRILDLERQTEARFSDTLQRVRGAGAP